MAKACITTGNEMKYRAARFAFSKIGVNEIFQIRKEVSEVKQPVGLVETVKGALARAVIASQECRSGFGSGVESGLIPFPSPSGYLVFQVAVVIDARENVSLGVSEGFELYDWENREVLGGKEMRNVIHGIRGGRDLGKSIGYIGYTTQGLLTRYDLTVHSLLMALKPWIHGVTDRLPKLSGFVERLREGFGLDL